MSNKIKLLEAIGSTNRGLLANQNNRKEILSFFEDLEKYNPTSKPLEAQSLLEGDWRLLYTTSKDILNIDKFPLFRLGQIYQCIRTKEAKVYNISEIIGLSFLNTIISVAGKIEPVSDKRVDVKFERGLINLQSRLNYTSPSKFIEQFNKNKKLSVLDFNLENRNQTGWLEITYLDEDLRLGRGNEGSLFVLTK